MTPPDSTRRRALAAFVRARRERLDPAAFGIADARRRRTPGLRREEMAQLAGLSTTWYTWIEQGRDLSLSVSALGRLARALGLAPAERAYLFDLAGRADPEARAPDAPPDTPDAVLDLVAAMPCPAYLLDAGWTARAWNPAAKVLFRGWLDRDGERNLLRFIFLSPAAPALIPDFENRAERVLAEFRADTSRRADDPALAELIADLTAQSPAFARMWRAQKVLGREGGDRAFRTPDGTVAHYRQVTLVPAHDPAAKLVVLTPGRAEGPPAGLTT